MKYYIPTYNLNKLNKLVEKLSKKTEVKYSVDKNDIQYDYIWISERNKLVYETIAVELEVDYKLGDYEVVAEIEHTDNGNIIRHINLQYEVPEKFRISEPYCEHCHTNRMRKNTFLLVNKEGNYKQVGRSCLNEYTGTDSLKVIELVSSLSFLFDKSYYELDEDFLAALRSYKYENLKEIANRMYQVLLNYGYDKEKLNKHLDDYGYDKSFDEELNKLLNVVNTDWYNPNSEYCHNIKVILQLECIEYKHWNFLFSYLNSAMKYLQNKNVSNNYLGQVNDRITFTIKTFKVLWTRGNTYYYAGDPIFTYRILDTNNNIIIWKTEKKLLEGMIIKATIKELGEYKEEKQTVVTRGTIIE